MDQSKHIMSRTGFQFSAMLKRAKIKCVISLLLFLLFSIQVSARDVGAPNIDFSKGNLSGWTLETGSFYRKADSTCTYEWTDQVSQSNKRFSLINSAISDDDPIVKCDDFKENPFSQFEHYVMAVGYTKDNKILVANSSEKWTEEGVQIVDIETILKALFLGASPIDMTWGERDHYINCSGYVVVG